MNGGVTFDQVRANSPQYGGFVNGAFGQTLIQEFRSNVQHPFDRIFFLNTANLGGQKLTFFQTPVSGSYTVLNGAAYTKTAEDTNWDQANQAQYSYLLTGMHLKLQNLEYQAFQASPLDLSTWSDSVKAMLEDMSVALIMEDNVIMRQKAVQIPEGNALYGSVATTGTGAAAATQSTLSVVSNGFPSASNIFSFGNQALWIPKGSRFNVQTTFGASSTTAAFAYKPTTQKMFLEIRFQGIKFQMPT